MPVIKGPSVSLEPDGTYLIHWETPDFVPNDDDFFYISSLTFAALIHSHNEKVEAEKEVEFLREQWDNHYCEDEFSDWGLGDDD